MLGKAGKWLPLWRCRKNQACPSLGVSCGARVRLLTSSMARSWICTVVRHCVGGFPHSNRASNSQSNLRARPDCGVELGMPRKALKTRPRSQSLSPLPAPMRALGGGGHSTITRAGAGLTGSSRLPASLSSPGPCAEAGQPSPALTPHPHVFSMWAPGVAFLSQEKQRHAGHPPGWGGQELPTPPGKPHWVGPAPRHRGRNMRGQWREGFAAHPSLHVLCPCCVHSLG